MSLDLWLVRTCLEVPLEQNEKGRALGKPVKQACVSFLGLLEKL